ncbi:MAG: SsrA-binding protein SmpB [Candidatus Omnitrophica bacterium]|nr:SsrA-binding protein SmpB [Candidatus Omnitrophota bacterium]
MKVVATHRKARHNYDILETYEAGMELKGMEVKSLRLRGCSIDESFARVENGEVFLYNMHIPEYSQASYFQPDTRRIRKLLLHKKEIKRLIGVTTQKGLTLIPLKVYFTDRGVAKVQIAVGKGRKLYDKRKKMRAEITKKEAEHEMRRHAKRKG